MRYHSAQLSADPFDEHGIVDISIVEATAKLRRETERAIAKITAGRLGHVCSFVFEVYDFVSYERATPGTARRIEEIH
jgi:hypothetical protein